MASLSPRVVEPWLVLLACFLFMLHVTLARPRKAYFKAAKPFSERVVQLGTDLTVTTHLVKSPREMWVIGKLIYLTNRTLVEVKPQEILVMTRPYGPPKITPWLPKPPTHSQLLFHDGSQKLSVVLTQINSLVIFYENSEFDINVKQEDGDGKRANNGGKSGNGGGKSRKGQNAAEVYNFLSVQLRQTSAVQVNATVGALTTTPAPIQNVSLPTPPAIRRHPSFQYHGHPITFFQEIKLFFRNMKELVNYGAELVKNSKLTVSFTSFIELYRPRRSDGTAF